MSSLITSILSTLKGAALIALCALAGARLLSTFQREPGAAAIDATPTPLPQKSTPSSLPPPPAPSSYPHPPPPPCTIPPTTASMILADFRRSHLRRKTKKRVRFDLVRNTLHTYTPTACKFAGVTFAKNKSWIVYEHEADPAGYDTLHCRKTLYIRRSGGPDVGDLDLSLLDDDGDVVGMGKGW
ncbi:MAG: hypothetical protein L6R35_007165 [Caloplaca aegaea]|nr:MAG: hypothetical protein L6R35_007165 [Caloplaca aegaea]